LNDIDRVFSEELYGTICCRMMHSYRASPYANPGSGFLAVLSW